MKLSQLQRQRLSTIVTGRALVCWDCAFVDYDNERSMKGHLCQICGHPSRGGLMYFPNTISVMVNLMQSAFHGAQPISPRGRAAESLSNALADDSRLATVIYFSTFVDLLLEHFLENVADAIPIPRRVYERLMSDHMYARARTEKLFPALTGQTWRQALNRVSKNDGCNYADVARFAKEVTQKRNALLHEGDKWAISKELPEQCINKSSQLADLFVALHNEHVFPLYQKSGKPYFIGPST